jgi:hypothetical protein
VYGDEVYKIIAPIERVLRVSGVNVMKNTSIRTSLVLLMLPIAIASAQRPSAAPATAPAGKAPDTVLLEELTWAEVRDAVKAGTTTVIMATAGTEQKGPHMVEGEHKFVMEYTGDKIARALGKTLVAPVVTYVPEGSWENPSGHMSKPGTITLPDDRFAELRKDQIKPWGGPQDSGVSGDPSKATAEIGRMGIEFKVNAGINQYKLLKNPPTRGGGRRGE